MTSTKKEFTCRIRDINDDNTFIVVASTETVDRYGEMIKQDGWVLDNYLKNPIMLWAHDTHSLPIAKATKVYVEDGQLIVEGEWNDANPNTAAVKSSVKNGFVNCVSVGFIPLNWNGNIYTQQELTEVSFVPVPANPDAVAIKRNLDAKVRAGRKYSAETVQALADMHSHVSNTLKMIEDMLGGAPDDENDDTNDDEDEALDDSDEVEEGDDEGEKSKSFVLVPVKAFAGMRKSFQDVDKTAEEALRTMKTYRIKR